MAGELNLQTTLGKDNMPVVTTQHLAYVLVEARPTGAAVSAPQLPLNLGLVLDRSGSMAGANIQKVREGAKQVLANLNPADTISLILFDDQVDVLVPAQPVANGLAVDQVVGRIVERGGTAISLGLRQGLAELRKTASPANLSRLLLLTDGETHGDEPQCQALAAEAGQAGVAITALGLGDIWNSKLLDSLAKSSGGHSDHIESPEQVVKVFKDSVRTMQNTVVTNAMLTLRLMPNVAPRNVWRVVPLIARLDQRVMGDRDVQVTLGELEKTQGQQILIELLLPPRPAGRYRVAQAEVRYDVPGANLVAEVARADVVLSYSTDPALLSQVNPQVMNLAEKVSVFNLQTRALDEAAAGNVAGATVRLRQAATRLLDIGEPGLATVALAEANNLEQQGKMSDGGTKKLDYSTRKLTQNLSS